MDCRGIVMLSTDQQEYVGIYAKYVCLFFTQI